MHIERLAENLIDFSVADSTHENHRTRERRYLQFCYWFQYEPFPLDEMKLIKFAAYLSLSMKSVESIKQYCVTICELNELKGFKRTYRGRRYQKAIMGIKRVLQHEVKQAPPITLEMLNKIEPLVDINNTKQLAIWVTMLAGFFLFLRKSNMIPEIRKHDLIHQISRKDVKFDHPAMVFLIKWSKTNQFGEILQLPVVIEPNNKLCLASWVLKLVQTCPAKGHNNLFSYTVPGSEQAIPVTYRELTYQMREWLRLIGEPHFDKFTSHSLRRGGTSHAFNNGVPEQTVKVLGNWASQCYRRYIELTVETRIQAWHMLNE